MCYLFLFFKNKNKIKTKMGGIRNYTLQNIIFVHDFVFIFLILVFLVILVILNYIIWI